MIDLHIHEVLWCAAHGHPVLALRVRDSDRYFAVALAVEDATALAAAPPALGSGSNRPRLYALLEATVAALGGDITEVQLFVGDDTILQAAIRFTGPQGDFTLPTHFADGIALAHRRRVPLRMADDDVARVPLSHRAARPSPATMPGAEPPAREASSAALQPYRDLIDSLNLDAFGAPEPDGGPGR